MYYLQNKWIMFVVIISLFVIAMSGFIVGQSLGCHKINNMNMLANKYIGLLEIENNKLYKKIQNIKKCKASK
jgi:hypothetical protein